MGVHAFDRRLMLRALAFTAIALAVAAAVAVATDEPFSTWRMRAARLAAFVPALAALGVAAAIAQARARGELRALAALGASPWRAALGATAAGWLAGAVGLAVLASPWADVRSLFPSVVAHVSWRPSGAGLIDAVHGARVEPSGEIALIQPVEQAIARTAEPGAREALLAVLPLALLAPPWASAPLARVARTFSALATVGLVIVLLHAIAASRLSPLWLLSGGALLALPAIAAHVWPRHRRGALVWL